jgi:acetyl esterase/lipase
MSRRAPFGPLRLLWGLLASLLSLLALLPAPTYLLWQVAVGVTEFGHWLAMLALAPLLPGWRRSRTGTVGAALGLGAAALALSPVLRALPIAWQLPNQLDSAFGLARPRVANNAPARAEPLSLLDLLRGIPLPTITPQRLVYSEPEGQTLALDFYPSARPEPAPLLVVVHGGSWQSGDSSQLAPLNSYLAARGYAVAAINYRLAPRWIFPAAHNDLQAALAFLKARAGELRIDATRIALLGRSAGGQLALLGGYTANDPAIRGVISFYAPTDMPYGYANPANPAVLDSRGTLEAYLGGTPASTPAAYRDASPIEFVGPTTPPTLLIHGPRDELVRYAQSTRLAERLQAANRPHLLLTLPWATHGCDFNFSGPSGQITTYAIERFLAAVMR